MAPPIVTLVVRALTAFFLVVSLIILTTNMAKLTVNFIEVRVRFDAVYSYRYMVATTVIGLAYTLLQAVLTISHISTGNRLGGDALYLFDFYGDKVSSYLLATGTAAGFAATVDLKPLFDGIGNSFFNKANAAASVLLIGFLFSAISSILSSLALTKRY